MSRRPRVHNSDKNTLKIFQANVGKIPPAHDCALALADSGKYDIILLQEPCTEAKNSRCLTKTHPAYDTYSPVDSWDSNDTRPRVMTHMLNGVTIVNFYRQPRYDVFLDVLLRWSAPERTLVAGDFNAKHYAWQTGRLEGRGEDIATWATPDSKLILEPSVEA
ncbi:Endonuclease/exonuclease/phosphatase [Metarhizium guizhouense ARSEF 977]|uniref:Endonuclease/exonuclease/phosphatase n=1 Tax=Metarhizium guizhouense (strain ARSEF 977) TaxID=1276136 RepID=A0A0B4HUQ6_METGA|nr:Endonuclease/exonuclease/phosphatase [Metarhizium guizhouense ARSEF 977]